MDRCVNKYRNWNINRYFFSTGDIMESEFEKAFKKVEKDENENENR